VSHIPNFGDASKSPAGDAAFPARDVVASPNCGICDTAEKFQMIKDDIYTIVEHCLVENEFQ